MAATDSDEFAQAYYVEHEGLSEDDAAYLMEVRGDYTTPTTWDDFIARGAWVYANSRPVMETSTSAEVIST